MLDLAAIKARAAARLGAHAHPQTPASPANWLIQPTEISQLAGVASPKPVDPDRWCWPSSDAMNGSELQTFTARVLLFTRRAMGEPQAEALADRLVGRDREQDDRRLCLECNNYRPGRCGNSRNAGLTAHQIGGDLAALLQRCPGFSPVPNSGIQPATPRSNAQLLKA